MVLDGIEDFMIRTILIASVLINIITTVTVVSLSYKLWYINQECTRWVKGVDTCYEAVKCVSLGGETCNRKGVINETLQND